MTFWFHTPAKAIDTTWLVKAQHHQNTLTKPPGALGQLETVACHFSMWQQTLKPQLNNIDIYIMAADHGVAAEGVSAFPQAVTGEMIRNFARGGAAISVLSRFIQARLSVVNLGTVHQIENIDGVLNYRIDAGTANICTQQAMTNEQLQQALLVGKQMAERAFAANMQLVIGGEMGIANTTTAACLTSRLLHLAPEHIVGPGTGINTAQLQHKIAIVSKVLALHPDTSPIDVLRVMGGFEIAALVGLFIRCAQLGIAILLDGYIVTAAALVAHAINPSITTWMLASHCSAEPAHHRMLATLQLKPLVDLSMRLGEGSGAAIVVPILQAACKLQSDMASFSEAGVSQQ